MAKKRLDQISIRKYQDYVRISLFTAHQKFFEEDAPMNSPEKIGELLERAYDTGLSKPKKKKGNWWD